MKPQIWIAISGLYSFLAVALGAFGAHALKDRLDDYSKGVYQTAVTYQMFHALAIFAIALFLTVQPGSRALSVAAGCFAVGILFFSGSLYALALSGIKVLGAITPIGGVFFLVGWMAVAIFGFKAASTQ